MKLPIASIIFEGDFRLGVLQALSIDRLYGLDTLSEYVIILNGTDNAALRSDMDAALRATSEKFRHKITYLEWKDLLGSAPKVGYYDQQALKLAVAQYFDTEFYILLDGKNHFVAPASTETFFREGKPIGASSKTTEYWGGYLMRSVNAMGANPETDWDVMMPSVTPAVMITKEVRAVIEYLKGKYSQDLPEALKSTGGTEFLLYYAHLRLSGAIAKYHRREMPARTLFTSWPQDPEMVLRFLEDLGEGRPVFGLHRKRIPQLNSEQREALVSVWKRQLLFPWEDPNWFLGGN